MSKLKADKRTPESRSLHYAQMSARWPIALMVNTNISAYAPAPDVLIPIDRHPNVPRSSCRRRAVITSVSQSSMSDFHTENHAERTNPSCLSLA